MQRKPSHCPFITETACVVCESILNGRVCPRKGDRRRFHLPQWRCAMATQATLSRIAFSRIMLATNLSPESQNVLEYAISFAKRYESKLFIAHALRTDVCVRGVEPQWQVHDLMQSNADRELAILEQRKDLKSLRHEIIVRSGEPSQVLSALASDENVDLIVMGTHGRGCISQLFLGSTAETMIRKATCPVLTMGPHVKPRCLDRFGNILYTTDFSECS